MRVVLEVLSGPDAGRKTLLGAGQMLRIGRTESADLCFPKDGRMSGVHFALETDNLACYVQDLGSSNGTLLNGKPLAQRAALCHGDKLRAGETSFAVCIEGADEAAAGAVETPGPGGTDTSPLPPRNGGSPKTAGVSYSLESCDSGLTLCRGSIEDIEPDQLATALGQVCPAWLIVDFHKLEGGLPEDLESADYLFDWLEPAAAKIASPLLLGPDEWAGWAATIQQGWGHDAVICLFSQQEKPALLAHLRQSLRVKPGQTDPSGGILGFCWPSVMASLLLHFNPESVARLLEGIDAVLVEFPDLPLTWQLFGRENVGEMLGQLGLVEEPPGEEAS
jgi:hypothetical protein